MRKQKYRNGKEKKEGRKNNRIREYIITRLVKQLGKIQNKDNIILSY
jgi:hypothetical protein